MLNPKLIVLLAIVLLQALSGQAQEQTDDEPLMASESGPHAQVAYKPAAVGHQQQMAPVYQQQQQQQMMTNYLDTQPEFTQAWADFPYAPGYLPAAYKSSHMPYPQQHSNYKAMGGYQNPNSLGYGYIDWHGPVNPAVLYVPVQLPYYYRVPPQSPSFSPQQAVYKSMPAAPSPKPMAAYQAPKQAPASQHGYTGPK